MMENRKLHRIAKSSLITIALLLCAVITLLIYHNHEQWLKQVGEINSNTGYGKGIIVTIWDHRDRTIKISYKVNNKAFETTNDWDNNPRKLVDGDSIRIKYSIKHPQFVITELEYEYYYPSLNRFNIF